jgi:hypothetical protein
MSGHNQAQRWHVTRRIANTENVTSLDGATMVATIGDVAYLMVQCDGWRCYECRDTHKSYTLIADGGT